MYSRLTQNFIYCKSSTLSCWSQCIVGLPRTLFTADLQLYRVGLIVQRAYPVLFGKDFILRLGEMHFLMNYVGAVGVLMAGSGMEELMKIAFGGLTKILTGKNSPKH